MSARDFENKVQEQMGEFRLPPSDALWQKVEHQLHQDRKRRRILIWLPILLLIGTGGYWWFHETNRPEEKPNQISLQQGQTSLKPTTGIPGKAEKIHTPPLAKHTEPKEKTVVVTDSIPSSTVLERSPASQPETADSRGPVQNKRKTIQGTLSPKHRSYITARTGNRSESKIVSSDITINNASRRKSKLNSSLAASLGKDGTNFSDGNETNSKEIIASDEKKPAVVQNARVMDVKVNHPLELVTPPFAPLVFGNLEEHQPIRNNKNEQSKKPAKWQWGVVASAGYTGISEGSIFNGLGSASVMDAYSAGAVIPNSQTPPPPPSAIKPAFGTSWGFFLQKGLSKRAAINIGLNYSYFSTRSSVGGLVDSQKTISNQSSNVLILDRYFQAGSAIGYTNRYHFLSLPVNWQIRLSSNGNFQFSWMAGFTLSQMVGTNALQYDSNAGIYYKDNSLFRKTQLGWQTGFLIGFNQKGWHPVELVPQFQYYSTGLLKTTGATKSHLWFGGIQFRYTLKK